MKRVEHAESGLGLVKAADDLVRRRGGEVLDQAQRESLFTAMLEWFERAASNDIVKHGFRVESMFAYVVGALGACSAIKEEDAGQLFAVDSAIQAPDFRVVSRDVGEFLVEVKNFGHGIKSNTRYEFSAAYFNKLRRYAELFGRPLKIAIYWSRARLWTLLPSEAFTLEGGKYRLPFGDCLMRNEMGYVGEMMLGTMSPLVLRQASDPDRPRRIEPDGSCTYTTHSVSLSCAGRRIEEELEMKLAWFLFRFGEWDDVRTEAEIENGDLIAVRLIAEHEAVEGQLFSLLGFVSSMISRQYNELTAPEKRVERFAPTRDPDALGVAIPDGYRGDALPLWVLRIQPASVHE